MERGEKRVEQGESDEKGGVENEEIVLRGDRKGRQGHKGEKK